MQCSPRLKHAARELFDLECQRRSKQDHDTPTVDFSPAFWLLSDLLQRPDRAEADSPEALESIVRRRVLDEAFVDSAGDAVIDVEHQLLPDQQVDLVVTVLSRVREQQAA